MNLISDLIYDDLSLQESESNIGLEKVEEISIDEKKFNISISDVEQRLDIKLVTGKCSNVLINQLARHYCMLGELFKDKVEFYNSSEILNLIEYLEKDKQAGTTFNRSVLKGYMHIHHGAFATFGYSLVRNVKEYWFNKNKKIKRERTSEYQSIVSLYPENIVAIANMMHQTAILNKNLRGEWLIYKIVDNRKYYLCLATHNEGDEKIFNDKIRKCVEQFPELI